MTHREIHNISFLRDKCYAENSSDETENHDRLCGFLHPIWFVLSVHDDFVL